jgi:hypothetical protein
MARDVEDELEDMDSKMTEDLPIDDRRGMAGPSLLETFQRVKREARKDSPTSEHVPLPRSSVADVEREIKLVTESRELIRLQDSPNLALPSVRCYTFHNTNDR